MIQPTHRDSEVFREWALDIERKAEDAELFAKAARPDQLLLKLTEGLKPTC